MSRRSALLSLLLAAACSGPRSERSAPPPAAAPAPGGPAAPAGKDGAPGTVAPTPKTPAEQARDLFAEGVEKGKAGAHEAAAEAMDRAFALDRSLLNAAYDAGVFFERAGDVGRARAAYEGALKEKPDFAAASHNLTRLRIRAGKAAEAEADLRARIERFPLPALRNQLVEAIAAQGRLDEAEAEARAILRASEQDAAAMVSLASIYYARKRFELAKMVLENARQVHPEDPAVWNKLAFVEIALGNRSQAMLHLQKAAALRDDYPEAHINYGALLVEAEDFAGASKELELAVKHAPSSAEAWLNLGNAQRGEKRFDEAKRAYERALLLDPKMAEAQWGLAVLFLDVEKPGLPTLERLERALAYLDRYAAAGGDDPRVAAYRKEGLALADKEKKRLAREERDRVRKEAEAKRKQEAEEKLRREEEEKRQAEERRLAEEKARLAAPPPAEALPATGPAAPPAPAEAVPGTDPQPAVAVPGTDPQPAVAGGTKDEK